MHINKLIDLGSEAPRIFIYSTGAGAGIQKRIWEVPGCSSFLIGCGFPYASSLTDKYIGFVPEKYVSLDTAIELAMAAYLQAYEPGHKTIGVGLTASVASTTEHKGDHKIVVSTFSDSECLTFVTKIPKGFGPMQRIADGNLSDDIGMAAILRAVGLWCEETSIPFRFVDSYQAEYFRKIHGSNDFKYAPDNTMDRAKELILSRPFYRMGGSRSKENTIDTRKAVFYPGSFNPFHFGHAEGAQAIYQTIAKQFGEFRDIIYTTVIDPPHKTALSASEMLDRVYNMKGKNFCLTSGDPLFIDKARRHPGAWFGLGADTLLTILDPKWGYATRDIILEFQKLDIKIFVLGRLVKDKFVTLSSLKKIYPDLNMVSTSYEDIFVEVPGRWDISSTELRTKTSV